MHIDNGTGGGEILDALVMIACALSAINTIALVGHIYSEYKEYRLWGRPEPWNEEKYQQFKVKWDKELGERQKAEKRG